MSRVYTVTLQMADLRRSKRFQPAALQPSAQSSAIGATWSGESIHVRPTVREDLFDAEVDLLENDDEEEDDRHPETVFYEAFSKSNIGRRYKRRGRSNAKAKAGKDHQLTEFKVGDAVLIDTGKGSRLPSIGVIVAMWETQGLENEDEGDGEDEEEDEVGGKGMKVKIHWFLRPTQLAGIRAKRDHVEVSPICSLLVLLTTVSNNIE
jgi:origin recognition complex subunit 1